MSHSAEIERDALDRAVSGQSLANYPAIFQGFTAKGIAEADIQPRVNVFTFRAWKAKGRMVCKGQHGVKVETWIPYTDAKTGEEKRRPKRSTVFHISQTKELNGEDRETPEEAREAEAAKRLTP